MARMGIRNGLFLCVVFWFAVSAFAKQSDDKTPKNVVVENLQVLHRFENDGTGTVTYTTKLRILTELGLKLYGAVYVPYASQMESLQINYLRTIKADGSVVSADTSKAMDITPPVARMAPMFSDVKIRVLVAPQLQVGDEVEYQYTRKIITPYMTDNFWDEYSLDRMDPIHEADIVLDVPAGRKLTFESDPCFHYTTAEKNGREVYQWLITDLKPAKDSVAFEPPLYAVSTLGSWKQVADWYQRLQRKGSAISPSIQALANKLTAGQSTPEQKLDAIYAYVSEKIRYVALEFGMGGYQAHAASAVLASGYGDCKDKAGLLESLLAAAGLKAYPVLVNAIEPRIVPSVPMPSQFDHVMTVVPMDGKNIWLDSTMETAPPGVLSPAVLGKQALLIEPGAEGLVTVPEAPPVTPVSLWHASGSIDAGGQLTLKQGADVNGINGVLFRQLFRLQDKNLVKKVVQRIARYQIAGATAAKLNSSDPSDLSGPFKFQYTLTKGGYLDLLQKNATIGLPSLLISRNPFRTQIYEAKEEDKEKKKASPSSGCAAQWPRHIKLYGPFEYQENLTLAVPAGFRVDLPDPVQVARSFGNYTSTYHLTGGKIEVWRDLKINASDVPLSQLDALVNFQGLIDSDLNQGAVLRRRGASNATPDVSTLTPKELNQVALEAMNKHHNLMLGRDLLLKAVAKDPHSKVVWDNLGLAYLRIGNYYQAKKAYRKQLSINAYDEYAYDDLGLIADSQGHFKRSIRAYKEQLQVNPLDAFAYDHLATTYEHLEDWNDAADAAAKLVRLDPNNALSESLYGDVLLHAGKTAEGKQALARSLEISKEPLVLNDVAYVKAKSGIDLTNAEKEARSAVDQVIPENVGSLEVPKDYELMLGQLSSYLDSLGWVLFKEGKLVQAKPYLKAAFEIRQDPDIAKHLAMLAMKQNQPRTAREYYSYAVAWYGVQPLIIPKVLQDYLRAHGGLPEMRPNLIAKISDQEKNLNRLYAASGHAFTWPRNAGAKPAGVVLRVLVDQRGRALDSKVILGSAPFTLAAERDVRRVRFPLLAWPNHVISTVRTAYFLYDPNNSVRRERIIAFSDIGALNEPKGQFDKEIEHLGFSAAVTDHFIVAGHRRAGLRWLSDQSGKTEDAGVTYLMMVHLGQELMHSGQFQAAVAVFRQAIPLQPKDDFAVRELARTLKAAHNHTEAIQAFGQLISLDPEDAKSHFSLAGEYQKVAASGQPANALQLALHQYALAAKLDPSAAAYHAAYDALYQKINHTHPPMPN